MTSTPSYNKDAFQVEPGYFEREGKEVIWLYLKHSTEWVCILQIRKLRQREV